MLLFEDKEEFIRELGFAVEADFFELRISEKEINIFSFGQLFFIFICLHVMNISNGFLEVHTDLLISTELIKVLSSISTH